MKTPDKKTKIGRAILLMIHWFGNEMHAPLRYFIVFQLAALLPNLAYGQESVGYPSVAAALEALKARNDVRISVQDGWTIVDDPRDDSLWTFTPPNHPAHPAVVKRNPEKKDGAMFIQTRALCHAEKAACDKLMADFLELNSRIAADIQRRSQAKQRRIPRDAPGKELHRQGK